MFIRSMEEDDESQSYPSPDGQSYSPPPPPPQQPPQSQPQPQPSNQIIVTVAAAPPSSIPVSIPLPPQQSSSNLTLALPIQQFSRPPSGPPVSGGSGGSGGREDCWSEGATSVLIDAWGERYMELSRGNLKQKHWKEVADIVSSREDYAKPPKTDIQCKNRIDTVKKKYKIEKQKVAAGCGPSRWPFFERLDRLIGPSATPTTATATVSAAEPPSSNAVPVGIPVGIRPLPLPFSPRFLQTPPHLQSQAHQQLRQNYQQQQQLQQSHQQQFVRQRQQSMQNYNFRPPPNAVSYLRNNANINDSNSGSGGSNVNHMYNIHNTGSGRPQLQQQFGRTSQAITMVDSDSEADGEDWSNDDSGDSLPPQRKVGFGQRKGPKEELKRGGIGKGKEKGKRRRKEKKAAMKAWGNSARELTRAILKFGEAYEAAESAKLEHIAEIEKQRMKFAKELELQRMKFMMKTQLQISQINGNVNGSNNSGSRVGASGGVGVGVGGENNHHHQQHIRENHLNHDANSDSSN